MRALLLATGLLITGVPSTGITREPADEAKNSPTVVTKSTQALEPNADLEAEAAKVLDASKARMKKLETEFAPRLGAAKTEADRDKIMQELQAALLDNRKTDREAIKTLMPLLRRSAANTSAVPGLLDAAYCGDDVVREEAGELLHHHHLTRPEVLALAESPWGMAAQAWIEPILRDLLSNNVAPANRRPRLRYALATYLSARATLPAKIADDPALAAEYGAERAAQLSKVDVPRLESEALNLFDGLVAQHAQDELQPGLTLGEAARSAAYEIRNLGIGKKAPEIAGEDLDGRPLRLSDYHGKVVILAFWGNQCSPCLEFARHERELVERFVGRPFKPLGVSVTQDREGARRVVEQHKITWPSFWSGPKGWTGDIPLAWNVCGLPTIYVIDHAGVIRSKNNRGPELDPLLEKLVMQAEAAVLAGQALGLKAKYDAIRIGMTYEEVRKITGPSMFCCDMNVTSSLNVTFGFELIDEKTMWPFPPIRAKVKMHLDEGGTRVEGKVWRDLTFESVLYYWLRMAGLNLDNW